MTTINRMGKAKDNSDAKNKEKFTFTDISLNSVLVKWEKIQSVLYELSKWNEQTNDFETICTTNEHSSFRVNNLSPNTKYKFRMRTKLDDEENWVKELILSVTTEDMASKERYINMLVSMIIEKSVNTLEFLKNHETIISLSGPNFRDKNGMSLLMLVARNLPHSPEVTEKLLEMKCDPMMTTSTGKTALHMAASEGGLEVCQVLLHAGVEVDPVDLAGTTPLLCALESNDLIMADFLIDKGASINRIDNSGNSLLTKLISMQPLGSTVEYVARKADVNLKDNHGNTALILAAVKNNAEAVSALLRYGADLNVKNEYGHTVMDCLSNDGYFEIKKILKDFRGKGVEM